MLAISFLTFRPPSPLSAFRPLQEFPNEKYTSRVADGRDLGGS